MEPYTKEDIDTVRRQVAVYPEIGQWGWEQVRRLLATLDALQARLDAAEKERDAMKGVAQRANDSLGDLLVATQNVAAERDSALSRATAAEGALRKVRAHTGHFPNAPRDLLVGLLASIARIVDAALLAALDTTTTEQRREG